MNIATLGEGNKRQGTSRPLVDPQQGGYATNFGASLGGAGSRGIEGPIIACIFKSLVTRLVDSYKELKNPDNTVISIFLLLN